MGALGLVEKLAPAMASTVLAATPVINAVVGGLTQLGSGLAGFFQGLPSGAQGAVAGLSGLFQAPSGVTV
ncbi:hypothetical protein [Streptomyces sp. AS02]|uniref:hypothetical protein n=1 Tax=Streptomyces sp. AS02 TaxID=2938946 RepID=UPI0020215D5A|nr:hypothetical protein [Streptomyces sp. AS02]